MVMQAVDSTLGQRLTLDQAIAYIGCSRSWFFRHVRPHVPVYKLHRDFYMAADLEAFVRSRRVDGVGRPHVGDRPQRGARGRTGDQRRRSWANLADKHGLLPGHRSSPQRGVRGAADGSRPAVGMHRACREAAHDGADGGAVTAHDNEEPEA
jgi:hypothetical protein